MAAEIELFKSESVGLSFLEFFLRQGSSTFDCLYFCPEFYSKEGLFPLYLKVGDNLEEEIFCPIIGKLPNIHRAVLPVCPINTDSSAKCLGQPVYYFFISYTNSSYEEMIGESSSLILLESNQYRPLPIKKSSSISKRLFVHNLTVSLTRINVKRRVAWLC